MTELDRSQVQAFRYDVTGLNERLDEGRATSVARAGLQDSSPRAALFSLHARVEGVDPDAWRGNGLTQVFGPRGAIYVVAEEDVALFTLGLQPRSPERLEKIAKDVAAILRFLEDRPRRQADIIDGLAHLGGNRVLRWAATTGRLFPVWDAIDTVVYPAPPPDGDPEECRIELARRFFHHMGPATVGGLKWWTDSSLVDAAATIDALGAELAVVELDEQEAFMLASDIDDALAARPSSGVRLLPPDDVYINRLGGRILVPSTYLYRLLFPKGRSPGALVVDGEVKGTWRRQGRRVSIKPWPDCDVDSVADAVAAEAAGLPVPGANGPVAVSWPD